MKFILILLLSLLPLCAKKFSIIVDKPFNESLFDITQDYDRGISAVGFTREYKTNNSNPSQTYTNAFDYLSSIGNANGTQMALIKVDKNANVVINKVAKMRRFNKAVAVVKTPANGYFIGGNTMDGELLIAKLDSNANLIFSKKFGTKNYDRMNNLILLSDGGVLAIGSSTTTRAQNEEMFKTGLGLNDIFVTRFNKMGTILWSKKYGTAYDDRGIDGVEAADGTILIVSTTSYDQNNNVTLMRLAETGNKIWLKHYKEESKVTPYKIIRLRDNNFLVSLSIRDEMNKEQIRLIKFNLQKNVLIDKKIHTTYSSLLRDIKEYSDGMIIGVGEIRDTYDTNGLVMMLDSKLSMNFQEHYGDENYDSFNAVTILHNSQAAIAGVNTSKRSQESNMWIVKINKDGSIAQTSQRVSSLYATLIELFKDEIENNKIVIKKDLSIEFVDKRLYFEVGKYKLSKTQKIFLDSFFKKLIPFLNNNKEHIKTLEINGHTSSEWGGVSFENNFLNNEKLSMNRSYSTISYMFKQQKPTTQKWLSKILKGSGLGFSKTKPKQDKERERRVSIKIFIDN
jgi:outer membrane protein OmpA-like peptidoglycan-associated protein